MRNKSFRNSKNVGLDAYDIEIKTAEILKLTRDAVVNDVIDWIDKYVPKRTGQLRDDLKSYVNTHWKSYFDLLIGEIGTTVPYANLISGNVKHHGTWFEHSGIPAMANYYNHSGPIFLYDPKAIRDWQTELVSYTKQKLAEYYQIYKTMVGL